MAARPQAAALRLPEALVPRALHNRGNFVISLGDLCQWLASQAEALGCNVLPGFAAADVLYDGERVAGVVTGDLGVARDGSHKPGYQPGYELRAKYTVFAEGCRGHLGRRLEARFDLRGGCRSAALRDRLQGDLADRLRRSIAPARSCTRSAGRSTPRPTAAGSSITPRTRGCMSGSSSGLGYRNPHLDPFAEFQRWKQHPRIRELLAGGERIAYGARAVNKGGLQSLPKLSIPGGVLVGCEAGFLNPAKIKGSHTAMKTRDARRGSDFRRARARRRRRGRGARALRRARPRVVGVGRAPSRPQFQRRASRSSARCSAARWRSSSRTCFEAARRGRCAIAAQDHARLRAAATSARPRVREAGRRRLVRSRELGVLVEHGARRESAIAI